MIDIRTSVRVTPKKNVRKSNAVIVQLRYSLKGIDHDGEYSLFAGTCIDSRSKFRFKHKFYIKRYGSGPTAKIKALCDCENFTYTWEVALLKQHSSVRYNSNGMRPRLTNPKMIPGLCKHLISALKATMNIHPTREAKIPLPRNF